MSPHGHIATIHRATFRVPEDVYDWIQESEERKRDYARVSEHASKCLGPSGHSGSNSYGPGCEEWGESLNERCANDFLAHWHNWVLQWQERMRREHGKV